jgi:hypothetical protein
MYFNKQKKKALLRFKKNLRIIITVCVKVGYFYGPGVIINGQNV